MGFTRALFACVLSRFETSSRRFQPTGNRLCGTGNSKSSPADAVALDDFGNRQNWDSARSMVTRAFVAGYRVKSVQQS